MLNQTEPLSKCYAFGFFFSVFITECQTSSVPCHNDFVSRVGFLDVVIVLVCYVCIFNVLPEL